MLLLVAALIFRHLAAACGPWALSLAFKDNCQHKKEKLKLAETET
jgi:hypothetical protein